MWCTPTHLLITSACCTIGSNNLTSRFRSFDLRYRNNREKHAFPTVCGPAFLHVHQTGKNFTFHWETLATVTVVKHCDKILVNKQTFKYRKFLSTIFRSHAVSFHGELEITVTNFYSLAEWKAINNSLSQVSVFICCLSLQVSSATDRSTSTSDAETPSFSPENSPIQHVSSLARLKHPKRLALTRSRQLSRKKLPRPQDLNLSQRKSANVFQTV